MTFTPNYKITSKLANNLMQIENARQAISDLPITASVLSSLRETARLSATHYSTMIEGNRLTQEQVADLIAKQQHFPGRERDEKEVLGYYAALDFLENTVIHGQPITQIQVQTLHALVMAGGNTRVKPTPYRDGQNIIRDSYSRRIVYLPPEAPDVPLLMDSFITWIYAASKEQLPCPIIAAIAHYQFATIHPYFDGNGRTARLLTTLILHLGGYDLKGLYSLEEYYARNLGAYYNALTIGSSHNYYEGRAEADITSWIEYFCEGIAQSFQSVKIHAAKAAHIHKQDNTALLRMLDPRQRKALILFEKNNLITSRDIELLFGISQRMARNLLAQWVKNGFIITVNTSKKGRDYRLAEQFSLSASK